MAVVRDSVDPMRDAIAKHAVELVTAEGGDASDIDTGPEAVVEDIETTNEPPEGAEEAETVVVADKTVTADEPPVVETKASPVVDKAAPPVKGAKEPVVPPVAKDKAADAAKLEAFAKEHGLKATDKLGRENRIPHSVVATRIVPNAIKKERTKWDAEVLKPVADKVATYEGRLNAIAETERIQFEEPRRFLSMLTHIPGYTQIFDEISRGKFSAGAKEAPKPADGTNLATDRDDPEPKADAKDDKGNIIGWTQEGLDKKFEWVARRAARTAREETLAAVDKKYKPLQDRFSGVLADEKVTADIDGIITLAAEWPGFTENTTAILAKLAEGKVVLNTPQKLYKATQDAYNEVMFGVVSSHKETEEERRARYFEEFQTELRTAPRSTAARTTARRQEPVVEDANMSADDRMRNIIVASARKDGLIK